MAWQKRLGHIGWIGQIEPRAAATAVGAMVVLGCGLWLAAHGGPTGARGRRARGADEQAQATGWVDERLEREARGADADPERECRIAGLRWNRALRLAQDEYYRQCGSGWTDDREVEYGPFRRRRLAEDLSGDVAATREAAQRALSMMPAGRARVRPLWFYSMACSAGGRAEQALGALIEITTYKPGQPWVWRLLAEAYGLRGDPGRADLAEEQAWRIETGRSPSRYITRIIRCTPYARRPVQATGKPAEFTTERGRSGATGAGPRGRHGG
jgi:hypothetical protein